MTNEERAKLESELAELEELERLLNVEKLRGAGAETMKSATPFDQTLIGAGGAMTSLGLGIKDLFTDLTQSEIDELEILAGGMKESGYATTGSILTDVAGMALPVGVIGNLVTKIATKVPALLGKASPALLALATDIGVGTGYEYAKAPIEGSSRESKAADAAIGGVAGAAGFSVLKKILQGVSPSKAAELMLKENPQIRLTPAQLSDNPLINATEQALSIVPVAGQGVAKLANTGLEDWNRVMLNKVNPSKDSPITEIAENGFKQLQNNFSNEYKKLWGQVTEENIDKKSLNKAYQAAIKSASKDLGDEANPTRKALDDATRLINNFGETKNTDFLQKADQVLRQAPVDSKSSKNLIDDYRKQIKKSLPEDIGKRISEVDKTYSDYKVLEDATAGTIDSVSSDIVSPRNLIGSIKKLGDSRALSRGEARLQKEGKLAADVFSLSKPDQKKMGQNIGLGGLLAGSLADAGATASTVATSTALATEPVRRLINKGVVGAGKDLTGAGKDIAMGTLGAAGDLAKYVTPDAIKPKIKEIFDKIEEFTMPKIDKIGDKQRALANILRGPIETHINDNVTGRIGAGLSVEELNSIIRGGSASYGAEDEY